MFQKIKEKIRRAKKRRLWRKVLDEKFLKRKRIRSLKNLVNDLRPFYNWAKDHKEFFNPVETINCALIEPPMAEMLKGKAKTCLEKSDWSEDEFRPCVTRVVNPGTQTSIQVEDNIFEVGDIVYVNRTGEQMQVVAVAEEEGDFVIVLYRAVNKTSYDALMKRDLLTIIGSNE